MAQAHSASVDVLLAEDDRAGNISRPCGKAEKACSLRWNTGVKIVLLTLSAQAQNNSHRGTQGREEQNRLDVEACQATEVLVFSEGMSDSSRNHFSVSSASSAVSAFS